MGERWADLEATPRFQAMVVSGLAGLALILACMRVCGVLSHVTVPRRWEIGIRVMRGARLADVQDLVMGEALALARGGAAIGLAGALPGKTRSSGCAPNEAPGAWDTARAAATGYAGWSESYRISILRDPTRSRGSARAAW